MGRRTSRGAQQTCQGVQDRLWVAGLAAGLRTSCGVQDRPWDAGLAVGCRSSPALRSHGRQLRWRSQPTAAPSLSIAVHRWSHNYCLLSHHVFFGTCVLRSDFSSLPVFVNHTS